MPSLPQLLLSHYRTLKARLWGATLPPSLPVDPLANADALNITYLYAQPPVEFASKPGWQEGSVTFSTVRFYWGDFGPREDGFKAQLRTYFSESSEIKKAYLAKMGEGDEPPKETALCLIARSHAERTKLLRAIGQIYAQIYAAEESMDIVLLTEKQDAQVAQACLPFYVKKDAFRDLPRPLDLALSRLGLGGGPGVAPTALLCPHCMNRQHGILQAVRVVPKNKRESGWQFYCKSGLNESPAEAHTVPLSRILDQEPQLLKWLDADVGTVVWRPTVGDPWEAWKDGQPIKSAKPGPGKNGNGTNGHHGNGTNGSGVHRNGAKDAEPESNGHYTNGNGANGHYSNGQGTNGAYHAAEPSKRFAEYEQADDSPRQYLKLQSGSYPVGDNLYYECYSCGDALPSLSPSGTKCRCGNFSVSQGTGRILIRDEAKIRVFRQG